MKDIIFVIFGSTGDLTSRKLLPAITKLYQSNEMSRNIRVFALGRREMDTDSYLDYIEAHMNGKMKRDILKEIVQYHNIQITERDGYKVLKTIIDREKGPDTKELYYLAIGPELFGTVADHIHASHIVEHGNLNQSIVFEKPFGHDLQSAKDVNQLLWTYFDEKQIYRIDHYLGKEMIQNIIMVRFANRIFEELWHNRTIKSIKIIAKESDGILSRAGYYDQSGALKDMVQSHLLQMLSLVAMDTPLSYHSQDVTDEKVHALKHLSFDEESMIFGQYKGYLNEKNIQPDSKTDTFIFLKAFVNTPRFKGVPFYLMTGKKLDKKESVIIVEFEATTEQRKWDLALSTNKLYIKIAPEDGFGLELNSKVPGLTNNVTDVELEYCVACNAYGNMPEAYEKLLLDITNGHKTLFTRWDEIEYSWAFIDAVKAVKPELVIYNDYDELKTLIKAKTKEDMI